MREIATGPREIATASATVLRAPLIWIAVALVAGILVGLIPIRRAGSGATLDPLHRRP